MSPEYLDFDLKIDDGTFPAYHVRATCSLIKNESREGILAFPFGPQELKNRLLTVRNVLLSSGSQHRKLLSTEEEIVREFGQLLFERLFTGDIHILYRESQRVATSQEKELRLRLSISSPKLAALPWEFLYDSQMGDYLCFDVPLVRYIALPRPIQPLKVKFPLRILGMAVGPQNEQTINIEVEKERLEQAIQPFAQKDLIQLQWVEGQTWRDLQQEIRRGPWHIFHFIGHGNFDRGREEGCILLADDHGQFKPCYATNLGRLLARGSLRLVLLNACASGQTSQEDSFSSIAGTLIQKGIPAVLSMQYEITDHAAIEFSRSFYEALTDAMPIDAAVVEARTAMSASQDRSLEWGIPVLHMQSSDGVLFEEKVEIEAENKAQTLNGDIPVSSTRSSDGVLLEDKAKKKVEGRWGRWGSGLFGVLMGVLLSVVVFSFGSVRDSLDGLFSLLTPTPSVESALFLGDVTIVSSNRGFINNCGYQNADGDC